MKIISGAQTGVDRAALDAALEYGVEAGGWCPQGRLSEDGKIPQRYPVKELAGSGYPQRTRQNVVDSDGTAIIFFGRPSGGTALTIKCCANVNRPYVLIDAEELGIEEAAKSLKAFIEKYAVDVLNVAGPRASGEPRGYEYAKQVMLTLFSVLYPTP